MKYSDIALSIIIPVYNRPQEVDELLESLAGQPGSDAIEIIIVEDGSTLKCEEVVKKYLPQLTIQYFYKQNSGPGQSRNFGCTKASGNYFIILDSDCVLPPHYISTLLHALRTDYTDAFGGPDAAHESFTRLQKAINYAMTSFFTTGGIRGSSGKLDKFYPRSFNMGFSKEVFEKTGGFPSVQFAATKAAGEDIELSIKIRELGYSVRLIKEAYVYHKRRTSLKQFFRQTYHFGYARISLLRRNKGALKAVHTLPSLFILGSIFLVLLAIYISGYFLLPLLLLTLLLFIDSSSRTRSIVIGALATLASYIQLTGYGSGFIAASWKHLVQRKQLP